MDLFYTGKTEDGLKQLKKDLRSHAKREGIDLKRKRLYLVHGDLENVGNNILFIGDPLPKEGFMKLDYDMDLLITLAEHNIDKYFITYCYLFPWTTKPTRHDVKDFSPWIHNLIDIIRPKLIVVLNELACFSFFNRKILPRENHGKIIGNHKEIPIIQTYPMMYFRARSDFEDMTFKRGLKQTDWVAIKTQYDKVVK